jgi:hypothetical protein
MGQRVVKVCDCCGRQIDSSNGVVVKGGVVKCGSMTVVLKEGEYCTKCASREIGGGYPDDPPD